MLCWYLGICGGLFVDLFIIVPSKLNFLTYIVLVLLCVTNCFQFAFCFVHIFLVFTVFEICLFSQKVRLGKTTILQTSSRYLKFLSLFLHFVTVFCTKQKLFVFVCFLKMFRLNHSLIRGFCLHGIPLF